MHDPTNDTQATGHPLGVPDDTDMDPNEYRDHQRRERYRKKRQEMDAAHEKAKAERERCGYVGGRDDTQCLLNVGHGGTHHFGTRAGVT